MTIVTILILIDGFLQLQRTHLKNLILNVTILILIDGFLQFLCFQSHHLHLPRHNPYFNRWFSAITPIIIASKQDNSHNPYFNRWFSAMCKVWKGKKYIMISHNPYFNRWFSAIYSRKRNPSNQIVCHNPYFNRWFSAILAKKGDKNDKKVTILILIDGFLQLFWI